MIRRAMLASILASVLNVVLKLGSTGGLFYLSDDGVPLNWFRYWFERVDFKIRGVNSLPKPKEPEYLDD